jgi:ribosomal protein S18 acetylase RimI-like enzyme
MTHYLTTDTMFTEIMHRPAYRLDFSDASLLTDEILAGEVLKPLAEPGAFCYSKIAINALDTMRFLFERGFMLIDTSTTFDKPFTSDTPLSGINTVRFATPDDATGTEQAARESFVYSRFHQDPLIPHEIANEIKAVWVGNFFRGKRGHAMIVAEVAGEIAGFLQLLYKGDSLVIDLIAVRPAYQRRGIARDMIAYAQSHCPPHQTVIVTTQLINIPSMRLYESLGFRMMNAQHIFHYHNL